MTLMRCRGEMTLKWQIDQTMASREVRNEGEVGMSSATMVKNLKPHMFRKREAMPVHRSFSCARS